MKGATTLQVSSTKAVESVKLVKEVNLIKTKTLMLVLDPQQKLVLCNSVVKAM